MDYPEPIFKRHMQKDSWLNHYKHLKKRVIDFLWFGVQIDTSLAV